MNYQERLERLEQRFLRADIAALLNAACVEGAIILTKLIDDGKIDSSEAIDQLIDAAKGTDAGLAEFSQIALFKQFAFFESSDRNILTLKAFSNTNGVELRSPKPDSAREQSERLAAFWVELMEFVKNQEDVNAEVRSIVARYRNKHISQNDKADAIAKAVTEDLWKTFSEDRKIKKPKRDYFYKLIRDCDGRKRRSGLKIRNSSSKLA